MTTHAEIRSKKTGIPFPCYRASTAWIPGPGATDVATFTAGNRRVHIAAVYIRLHPGVPDGQRPRHLPDVSAAVSQQRGHLGGPGNRLQMRPGDMVSFDIGDISGTATAYLTIVWAEDTD